MTPEEERNLWIRRWARLERHVSRHVDAKRDTGFCDDADDVLHRAWRQELKEAATPNPSA